MDIRIQRILQDMKRRCNNKNRKSYKNYGGRGIKVCEEWNDKKTGMANFYKWSMENGYKDNLTIDRIDVNGNYEPSNCRWSTLKEQCNNKRNNYYVYYENKKFTVQQLADKYKINKSTLLKRLKLGLNVKIALLTPTNKQNDFFNARKHPNKKKVLQYDLKGNFIKEWDSINSAQKTNKIYNISKCCNKKQKTAGGYIWKIKAMKK